MKTDPTLAKIAAKFTKFHIKPDRGAYMVVARRTSTPIARLNPIPNADRFELFYWSNAKSRWTTFGNMGRMKLRLESAHEIVESDPMFRVPPTPVTPSKLAKVKLRLNNTAAAGARCLTPRPISKINHECRCLWVPL